MTDPRKARVSSERLAWLGLGMLVLVFAAAGLVSLPLPFTRDQGIYAYNGWRWLGEAVPYRDTFGHKGPMLYALYALGLNISGGAMWGPNLLDLLARSSTIVFVFLAARALIGRDGGGGPGNAPIFAACFVALPLFGIFNACWWNAQAETFMMPPMAAAAWLAARGNRDRGLPSPLLAGALCGMAAMLKSTGVLHCLFLLVWVATEKNAGEERPGRASALAFVAGLAAGAGAWLAYFALRGALYELFEFYVLFNLFHGAASGAGAELGRLALDISRVFAFLPLLALASLVLAREGRGNRRALLFACFWFLSSLFQVLIQGKFFPYHWLAAVPPMGLLAGLGLVATARLAGGIGGQKAGRAAILSALALGALFYGRYFWLAQESYRTLDYVRGEIGIEQYYARFNTGGPDGGDFNLLASAAAADFIRKNTAPGDKVLVFGYEPLVNYLAARPAPGRFEIDYPLTFSPGGGTAARKRLLWRIEFLDHLERDPPALVAIVDNDRNPIEAMTSAEQAREFEGFRSWLDNNYEPLAEIEDFSFYRPRRRAAGSIDPVP